jgi:hypothetical protein
MPAIHSLQAAAVVGQLPPFLLEKLQITFPFPFGYIQPLGVLEVFLTTRMKRMRERVL